MSPLFRVLRAVPAMVWLSTLVAVLFGATAIAQHQWKPMPWPSVRSFHSLAYDPNTSSVLMFGGWDEFNRGDTWRWSGAAASWQLLSYAGPSPRHGAPVVYDGARNTHVLFGGYDGGLYNQTWIWNNGAGWRQIVPGSSPSARDVHAMAYDPGRGRVVLFGGYDGGNRDDTWEWNGNTWSSPTVLVKPSPRYGHSMAFDAQSNSILLFGGTGPSAQTWSWNGTTWTLLAPPQSPPARWYAAMAADPLNGTIVLHGGWNGSVQLGDTWIWNGALGTWTPAPAGGPGPREGHAATFDAARQRVVLVGGQVRVAGAPLERVSDVWEWDGATWTQAHDTLPSSRIAAAATFHADTATAERRVVLFGGRVGPYSSNVAAGDTWLWDGTTWIRPGLASSPPARGYSSMVFDPLRGESVLFGGWTPSYVGDTWVWDGTAWQQRSPANSPSARHGHAMAFVPTLVGGGGIVLFGGYGGSGRNDLWQWDGNDWTNLVPHGTVGSPSARWYHAMAYDPPNNRLVLFGGYNGSSSLGDTWAWTPAAGWTQLLPSLSPVARHDSRMQFDVSRGYVALVAGYSSSSGYLQDTWELRGAQWVLCAQTQPPPARDNQALVYDPDRQRLYLFGGYLNPGEFWEAYNPWPASVNPLPGSVGCAVGPGGPVPQLGLTGNNVNNLPWLGGVYQVTLSNLPAGFPLSLILWGLPPAIAVPLPWPGCTLYVNSVFASVAVGSAPHTSGVVIPWDPSLLGQEILCQGGVLNGPNVGASNALVGRIGTRH